MDPEIVYIWFLAESVWQSRKPIHIQLFGMFYFLKSTQQNNSAVIFHKTSCMRINPKLVFCFFFCFSRWPTWTAWPSGGNRDVHTGMPHPGTLGQLLDAAHIRNIPAGQVPRVQFWLSEGMGSQGQTCQRTHSHQNLEKWKQQNGAIRRQEAVWKWGGTLHQQQHGWHSPGESQVLPAVLLPRQPKGPAAIRRTLFLCCGTSLRYTRVSWWTGSYPSLFPFFSLQAMLLQYFSHMEHVGHKTITLMLCLLYFNFTICSCGNLLFSQRPWFSFNLIFSVNFTCVKWRKDNKLKKKNIVMNVHLYTVQIFVAWLLSSCSGL